MLALAACGAGGETPVPNYLARLGRSLDLPPESPSAGPPTLPRSRDLHIDLQAGSLDLLDMLALGDCRLDVTIGKSNSSLGKLTWKILLL